MFDLARPLYPALFAVAGADPETAHQQMLKTLSTIERSQSPWGRWLRSQFEASFCLEDERLHQNLWGLAFNNPVGLAAGFDKNGVAAGIWPSFGFGFAELGAVTLQAQPGNPRPRLFRLAADRAALNRMGANNLGAAAIANSLQETWQRTPRPIPMGINLCKSKSTPLDEAAADYVGSFRLLKEWADYFVINVSSPNTPGLRSLQATEQLHPILAALQKEQGGKPLLIKISPDLDWEAITAIIDLAQTYALAGLIAINTTTRRDHLKTQTLPSTGKPLAEEAGGISGAPLSKRSTEVIRFIAQQTKGQLPIVGVGGIFTAEDAWEKITAGASLLQIYTGWFYEGPWIVPRILAGLMTKLEERGLSKLSEAVGLER
ncbi:MAG: quinone-dependent dihydroorotate dehydrogenase [Cyanophyceae cyanobacterium]